MTTNKERPQTGGSFIRQKDGALKESAAATRDIAGGGARDSKGETYDKPADAAKTAAGNGKTK